MFENPRKFFIQDVLSSYEEYCKHRESNDWGQNQLLRKGINTAVALYHFREHLPLSIRPQMSTLEARCPDYDLVRDITNVSKHKRITLYTPRISDATQIYEAMTSIMFSDDQGDYFVSKLEIYLKLDDGAERKLTDVLYNVMLMWRDVLSELSIIDMKAPKTINDKPLTRKEAARRQTNMCIRRGEEFKANSRLLRYNYTKGIAEPIDLTGSSLQFKIYKLPQCAEIHISLVHPASPEQKIEFDFKVPFTKKQAMQYMRFKSESEKGTFVKSIIDSNQSIREELNMKIQEAIMNKHKGST